MFDSVISDNLGLTVILVTAVTISLGLSVTTLILQIRRNRPRGQTPIAIAKAGRKKKSPAPPPAATGYSAPYPPMASAAWHTPVAPARNDTGGHTEPLFPSEPQLPPDRGDQTEHIRNDVYLLYVRETSPDGEKDHEISVFGVLSVGRAASCGLQINHSTVSGQQCVLISGPDSLFVSNRSNSNITRLNGTKLEDTVPLKAGDTLGLGSVQLVLMDIRKYAIH